MNSNILLTYQYRTIERRCIAPRCCNSTPTNHRFPASPPKIHWSPTMHHLPSPSFMKTRGMAPAVPPSTKSPFLSLLFRDPCRALVKPDGPANIPRFPPPPPPGGGANASGSVREEDVLRFCFPDMESIKPVRY